MGSIADEDVTIGNDKHTLVTYLECCAERVIYRWKEDWVVRQFILLLLKLPEWIQDLVSIQLARDRDPSIFGMFETRSKIL